MRIFPIALIVIGSFGVAKYLGLIPPGMFHLIGPMLLIALGVALLLRPRRWRGDRRGDQCGDWRGGWHGRRSDGGPGTA